MEIQTDQGILVVNLDTENCITNAAIQHMAKGDFIYTLSVANGDDSSTMVQIPVQLQCGNNIPHTFGTLSDMQQQDSFDQLQLSEQLHCPIDNSDKISQIHLQPLKVQCGMLFDDNVHVPSLPIETSSVENIPSSQVGTSKMSPAEPFVIDYKIIYNYVASGTVPNGASDKYVKVLKKRSKHYSIMNNELCYGKNHKRVIMDKKSQQDILKSFHIEMESGIHFGARKMYGAISSAYFWQEMYMDVTNFVRQCEGCSETVSKPFEEANVAEKSVNVPITREFTIDESLSVPLEEPPRCIWLNIEAQIHGPFTKTSRLNEYVLTLADPVSRWITALPVPDNNLPMQMANFLFENCCIFGFTKCRVVCASYRQFEAIHRKFQERVSQINDVKMKLIRKSAVHEDCLFAQHLITSVTANSPANWDLDQEQFLYKYRTTAEDGSKSPFEMMFCRLPIRIVEEEKENTKICEDEVSPRYTSKRRRLQCSILQCRHCEDVFTSKISFRIHQRKHTEDARRRGILDGQEQSSLSGFVDKKSLRNKIMRKKHKLIRRYSQSQENSNRTERLLLMMNRISGRKPNKVQVLPSGGHHEEVKAHAVAAVKEILASTKEVRRKRGKYQKYPAELQEEMACYAIEHGNFAAVQHFTTKLGTNVSDSTIRNLVKLQRSFSPDVKQEIGCYAASYGVEAASSFFTKKLGHEVRNGIVRKFKKQYSKNIPELSQPFSNTKAETTNEDHILNSKKRVAYTAEQEEEIGLYATQFTIADTLAHFSNKLKPPLKKGTVRKLRKMYMEKHKLFANEPHVQDETNMQSSLSIQENPGSSTSQTMDILNASLNLLNNQHISTGSGSQTIDILNSSLNLINNPQINTPSTIIYNHLYQPCSNLIPTPIRFHSFTNPTVNTSVPMPYTQQSLPAVSCINESALNQMNEQESYQQSSPSKYTTLRHQPKNTALTNAVLLQPLSDQVYSSSGSTLAHRLPVITSAPSQPQQTSMQGSITNHRPLILSTSQEKHKDIYSHSNLQNIISINGTESLPSNSFSNSLPTIIADCDGTYTITSSNINPDNSIMVHDQGPFFSESLTEVLESVEVENNYEQTNDTNLKADVASHRIALSEEDVDDPAPKEPAPPKSRRRCQGRQRSSRKKDKPVKRGTYTAYSPEVRAEIGKYAAEHGSQNASYHFEKILGHDVPESTVRGLRDKYLLKCDQLASRRKSTEVTSLGYSPRGRPMRLGKYDAVVQDCLRELVKTGEKVSSFLAIATAKQVVTQYEPGLLEENGGTIKLNITWAKSFLKRIGVHSNS